MNQLGSEEFSQNQKNILQNIQANIINYTPTQIIQIVREKVTQRPLIKASPYKGLYKFNAGDKDKFFGRDALIQGFLNAINSSPLSLILGASGSGKSSLIRAGVIPRLKQLLVGVTFYDFIVEPGENPFTSLYNSFLNNEKDYHFNASDVAFLCDNSSETLPKTIKELKKGNEYWLLFIDQFEQVFTNCRDVQIRDNFIDGLVQVANLRDSSVKIVLAMRADFSEYLSAYTALGEILNQNNIHLVTDMHPDELRQVIQQPAAQHGVVFEEGLVEQIIKDVQGQSGSLPLLQYALQLLWEEECKLIAADGRPHIEDRTLNTFNYNVLEGVRGALQKHINYIYQKQNEEEKLATKQIFLRLVRIDETDSGSRAVSQIASRSDFVGVSQEKVLENLINKNLLVSDSKYLNKEDLVTHINTKREQVATVELAHEILLSSWDTLRGWLEEEKQAIILRNWLADEAKRWNKIKKEDESKAKNELVRSSRLDEIVAFREADRFSKLGGLTPIENEYIDASVQYRDFLARQEEERRQKELKQARRIAIGASVGGTIMLGLASFAGFSAWDSMKQKERAILSDIEATMSNSDSLLRAGKSFQAFIEALKGASKLRDIRITDSNNNIKRNLSISIQNSMNQISNLYNKLEDHSDSINSVSFSPDGEFIASGGDDKTVKLWNRQGKLLRTLTGHTQTVNSINFSPDGNTVISGSDDGTVKLWNLQGELLSTLNGTLYSDTPSTTEYRQLDPSFPGENNQIQFKSVSF
ncbi:MAG: hypothetical protein RLZZ29_1329, partial [Cyanobacteriota bacterium]